MSEEFIHIHGFNFEVEYVGGGVHLILTATNTFNIQFVNFLQHEFCMHVV